MDEHKLAEDIKELRAGQHSINVELAALGEWRKTVDHFRHGIESRRSNMPTWIWMGISALTGLAMLILNWLIVGKAP